MRLLIGSSLYVFLIIILLSCKKEQVTVITSNSSSVRTIYGTEKLAGSLSESGYRVKQTTNADIPGKGISIITGELQDPGIRRILNKVKIEPGSLPGKEGFVIKRNKDIILVAGADESGTLYGCLELDNIIKEQGRLPVKLDLTDQPEMIMRGTCIGLQKTTYLPGRSVYEYPYTPENFPWFYNKVLWIDYLDMLVENRFNSLYLWNGHPFASLVRLDDYPYAVEVDEETFKKNEDIFSFLTEEADRRGIYVIQMFYNIIVSKPFAGKHGLKTQDRSRPIIPVIADYTRKSIAAFVEKYPNVGLMVALGEAIGTDEDDVKWFTETIIPGVKEGLAALGRTDEPPLILRGHDTKAELVVKAALPLYKNLYTTHKYNGESLTTYEPRGSWAQIHQDLSKLGSVHISNIHILANLEPFRYGSPDFIQKSVKAMHDIQGANGLHLYPQSSYWDWPYTADKTSPRLLQVDRDWIWYRTWGRYAWNSRHSRNDEIKYWTDKLGKYYGCGKYGRDILDAYEQTGEIAPKLLRRFGISDGNRQTLLLGMFMSQLVNPYKWRVYSNFYTSNGPEGEIIVDYVKKEWEKEPHVGETPLQIIKEVVQHGKTAVESIEKAAPNVKTNKEEFSRLKNDIHCYQALANFFAEKVNAALLVSRYRYSKDISDLDKAVTFLEKSIEYYEKVVELTRESYLYANSMQTRQRRIPIGGDEGKNKTWAELSDHYRIELVNFKKNIQLLKSSDAKNSARIINEPFIPVTIKLLDKDLSLFPVRKNQKVYSDKDYTISEFVSELKDLYGVKYSFEKQRSEGTTIRFRSESPVKVLVGYFNGHSWKILPSPNLETDANANDRQQADIKIANALDIPGLYPVNIHSYTFGAGDNVLELGKGIVLILGFMDASQTISIYDAGLGGDENIEAIDWLFY